MFAAGNCFFLNITLAELTQSRARKILSASIFLHDYVCGSFGENWNVRHLANIRLEQWQTSSCSLMQCQMSVTCQEIVISQSAMSNQAGVLYSILYAKCSVLNGGWYRILCFRLKCRLFHFAVLVCLRVIVQCLHRYVCIKCLSQC
jgi:hypothetical protein